ncbi:energy-coupling factor transporter transmembrane component T family protein [Ardenticatena maritima]|uniref:Energy-coupling factor transport system permease protein n=1 Tax=Ardenticatena maritima TaxID=872965 RepID=A0A0N8GS86_9CHLR|nr:energy-coupling factor transporter transmembrane component T [Ardenticatena maritima]KPL88602.1 hypothetical protein SE16_07550 [Ardenticatena maritima]
MQTGLYLPGNGFLHRLHPLTKVSGCLALLVLAGLPWQRMPHAWLWAVLLLGILALAARTDGDMTFRTWARRLLLISAPFLLSMFLINGFLWPNTTNVLWEWGLLRLSADGLAFSAVIATRLVLAVAAFLLLFLTTHPADFVLGLEQLGLSHELAYLLLAVLSLLPRMYDRLQTIMMAQQARGLQTSGTLIQRMRALLPLFGPLVISALQDVEERAMALEARAFRAPTPKTTIRTLHDTSAQRIARWGMVLAALLLVLFMRWRFR